jgi:hypothetical protein
MRRKFVICICIGVVFVLANLAQATIIYGVTGSAVSSSGKSEVFKLNTSTKVITILTTTSAGWLHGDIAVTPSGLLYTVGVADGGTWSRSLMRLNPTTGVVEKYWKNNLPINMNALEAIDDTTLLGVAGGSSEQSLLYLIELDGAAPVYTNLGRIDSQSNSGGDIAHDPNGTYIAATDSGSDIWRIPVNPAGDPLPSSATKVCEITGGLTWVGALAFDKDTGVLYAGRYNQSKTIYTLNLATGALTPAAGLTNPLQWGIYGFGTAVPEPTSIALLGLGFAALIKRRRNENKR